VFLQPFSSSMTQKASGVPFCGVAGLTFLLYGRLTKDLQGGTMRDVMAGILHRSFFDTRLGLLALVVSTALLVVPASSDASQAIATPNESHTAVAQVGSSECMIEPWECPDENPVCIQEVGAPCPEDPFPPEYCIQEVGAPCPEQPSPANGPVGGNPISGSSASTLSMLANPTAMGRSSSRNCGSAKVRRGGRCVHRGGLAHRACGKYKAAARYRCTHRRFID
jgi:hypothetical protein